MNNLLDLKKAKLYALEKKLSLIAKDSLLYFVPYLSRNYTKPDHLLAIVSELEAITLEGQKKNICLSAPPQHYKTSMLQHWVAFHLMHHPKSNIVYLSYNETIASERVYEITKLLTALNIQADEKQSTKKQYWTKEGGKITAAGIDVGFTGRRADIIIIDDPHRTLDDVISEARMRQLRNVFEGVVETREQSHTSVIVTHTRWHRRDLIGWILENRTKYKFINIPVVKEDGTALLPNMLSIEDIEKKQKENEFVFSAMYMGEPPSSQNSLFNESGVSYYTELPNEYDRVAIGCDLAYTDKTRSDYSVIVVMYKIGSDYYVDDVQYWQSDFNYTRGRLLEVYEKYQLPIEAEYNGVQKGIVDTLTADGLYISKQFPANSKYARSLNVSADWNLGKIHIKKADWNEFFLKIVLDFTGSGLQHDDVVDAMVYAHKKLQTAVAFA